MKLTPLFFGVILLIIGVFLFRSGSQELFLLSFFFIPLGTGLTFIELSKFIKEKH